MPDDAMHTPCQLALAAILRAQAGQSVGERWLAAMLGPQVFTGAMNDLVDRNRDAAAGLLPKPLAAG